MCTEEEDPEKPSHFMPMVCELREEDKTLSADGVRNFVLRLENENEIMVRKSRTAS